MSEPVKKEELAPEAKEIKKERNGLFALGAGTTTYGVCVKIFSGYVCPACLILAPLLFIAGLLKHLKFKKTSKR